MLEEGSECVQAELEAIRGETGADILWPPALNYRELNSTGACFSIWAGSLGMFFQTVLSFFEHIPPRIPPLLSHQRIPGTNIGLFSTLIPNTQQHVVTGGQGVGVECEFDIILLFWMILKVLLHSYFSQKF